MGKKNTRLKKALPATGIFDTDRFAGGTDSVYKMTLAGAMTASATSALVTSGGSALSSTDVPYTLLIGSEMVSVTAVTGTTTQTATVVRGVGGTTAATHALGDLVEVSPIAYFAF